MSDTPTTDQKPESTTNVKNEKKKGWKKAITKPVDFKNWYTLLLKLIHTLWLKRELSGCEIHGGKLHFRISQFMFEHSSKWKLLLRSYDNTQKVYVERIWPKSVEIVDTFLLNQFGI